mmetsp:Transcript_132218/g.233087  ORF Transcript_132218/g.233087 Transcript_132218/m.233087 type:complete len:134 (-) Transcript_132218:526-927(-)
MMMSLFLAEILKRNLHQRTWPTSRCSQVQVVEKRRWSQQHLVAQAKETVLGLALSISRKICQLQYAEVELGIRDGAFPWHLGWDFAAARRSPRLVSKDARCRCWIRCVVEFAENSESPHRVGCWGQAWLKMHH